jgi:hypothetical protein
MNSPDRIRRFQRVAVAAALLTALSLAQGKGNTPPPPLANDPTPIQVFGVWHCGGHYCDWNESNDDLTLFKAANGWLVDRGDGKPAVNIVVLSFVHPLRLLDANDTGELGMVPRGMTQGVVDYFKSHGIRVMLSIGGITYTDAWDAALALSPEKLAAHAVMIAQRFGAGIEIDYENSSSPNIAGLERFIRAYRQVLPYNASGSDPAARLTIDVAAGDRWLIELNRYATQNWLRDDSDPNVKLDYANAMVSGTSSGTPTDWQEHVDGKPQYVPKVPPLAPARFTGGLYLKGNTANCLNFAASEQKADANYVQKVMPNQAEFPTGYSPGMLGYMFWAAGVPSARKGYVPATDCDDGMGVAATTFKIPVPMPPLRQK